MQLFIHSVPTTKLICNQFTVDALEQTARTAEASEAAHVPHTISVHKVLDSKRCNRGLQSGIFKTSATKRHCAISCLVGKIWVFSGESHGVSVLSDGLLSFSGSSLRKTLGIQTLNIHKHYSSLLLFVLMQYYSPSTDGGSHNQFSKFQRN